MDTYRIRRSPTPPSLVTRAAASLLVALVAGLVLPGCSRKDATSLVGPTPVSPVAARHAPAAPAALLGAGHLDGTIGPGAQWAIDVPENWNGNLVVWLHGYTNPAAPIALPAFGPFRDAILSQGYAVIASSYSENGYDAKEATEQAHQLRGVFASRVRQPGRTYLVGVSLGGLVGALLAERYPEQYDGGILVSGVVGGSDDELRYVGDVRVLFDAVYPGVLPGSLLEVPPGTDVNQAIGKALAAIQANPQGVGVIAALARVKPEYASGQTLVNSVLTAIGFQLQGANDLLARAHGHSFFDNRDWTYTGPLPQPVLDQVNATVARYASTPDAENYVQHHGEPSGALRIPIIALHNGLDPVVPYQHEALYLSAVGDQGAGSHLLQRKLAAGYGHVVMQPSELVTQLADLSQWVETGVKPSN